MDLETDGTVTMGEYIKMTVTSCGSRNGRDRCDGRLHKDDGYGNSECKSRTRCTLSGRSGVSWMTGPGEATSGVVSPASTSVSTSPFTSNLNLDLPQS